MHRGVTNVVWLLKIGELFLEIARVVSQAQRHKLGRLEHAKDRVNPRPDGVRQVTRPDGGGGKPPYLRNQ